MAIPCDVCGEGYLAAVRALKEAGHRRVWSVIPFEYSICDGCGSEIATPEQIRANARAGLEFKEKVDHMLAPDEIGLEQIKTGVKVGEIPIIGFSKGTGQPSKNLYNRR